MIEKNGWITLKSKIVKNPKERNIHFLFQIKNT